MHSQGSIVCTSVYTENSVDSVPPHYYTKDFESWEGYFVPNKLFIKVLNIMLPAVPAWQMVLESHIKRVMLQLNMDHDDAEYEMHSRLLEGDVSSWKSMLKETWELSARELTITTLITDLIRKCIDHRAYHYSSVEDVDKLTKLVTLSYHRKIARYGTGYFNGERRRVLGSLWNTALWSSRHQRTAMFAADIVMATWPYIATPKKTCVTVVNRARKGTFMGWTFRGVFFIIKKGVYHAMVWGCSAAGIAVIGAYWPLAKTKVLGDVGVLLGGLMGESFAGLVCGLFDGVIEPSFVKDSDDEYTKEVGDFKHLFD